MNIMNKLTLKHIRKNKARTIVTIIGIVISVAMLTAVTTGVQSGINWMREIMFESDGKWHIEYKDIAADKFTSFIQEENPGEAFMTQTVGYANLSGSQNQKKPYVYIQAVNDSAFSNLPLHLEEGRFPENEEELVISRHIIENGHVNVKIGDTVTYELGERYIKNISDPKAAEQNGLSLTEPLSMNSTYLGQDTELSYYDEKEERHVVTASEELRFTGEKKTYKVVGIISKPSFAIESSSAPGYSVFTYLNPEHISTNRKVNGYVYYNNVSNAIYKDAIKDALRLGLEKPYAEASQEDLIIVDISNAEVNQDVLYYEGVTPDQGLTTFITVMYILLIVIIMIGSITLIYNSFAISISERSKQLGMLSSVGATKRQKRNTVFFEAFVYGAIGIPLGILSGIVGMSIAFKIVSPILIDNSSLNVPLTLQVSAKTLIISVIVAIVTIVISAYIPAIRASRISPIEAIRQSKDIKITKKKVRTSRLNRLLFGFEGELALKNMKRNKKRYRSIIFSLFISVVLFITVSAFIYYSTSAYTDGVITSNYDARIFIEGEDQKQDQMVVNDLKELPSIAQVTRVNRLGVLIKDGEKYVSDEVKKYVEQDIKSGQLSEDYEMTPNFNLYAMDDDSYQAYCKAAGIEVSGELNKNQGVLINKLQERRDYSIDNIAATNLSAGDTFVIENDPLSTGDTDEDAFNITMEVAAITEVLPIGIVSYGESYTSTIYFVISESTFNQIKEQIAKQSDMEIPVRKGIYVKSATDASLIKDFETVLDANGILDSAYDIYDVKADEQSGRQLVYAVSIFSYGFITLMSLICCANMCNTISTSINLRRSEFAMLKSVGMTPKRFHRMIMFESMLYGIKALAYGLPVSVGLSYLIYLFVTDRFEVGFMIPAYIYIGTFVLVFAIVGSAMFYSSRKVRKENIIDGLKTDIV
ncbi:MAG: FtsX-like permease family protein [bacterium]|nr:FtsX-like permease family protein [bacterium]